MKVAIYVLVLVGLFLGGYVLGRSEEQNSQMSQDSERYSKKMTDE